MSAIRNPSWHNASRLVALLGPTNTGKTHRAVQRMLTLGSGMIGLPLRLLAREVYTRLCQESGTEHVALITGEERIVPIKSRFWVCTVESMPVQKLVPIVVIDEIQLATHPTRGHVFTDRLLNARGTHETWFLGSDTMRDIIEDLLPTTEFQTADRHSKLKYVPPLSLSKLPSRSAVVAFSMSHVYEIAEQIRNIKGGVAIVLGALSPKARNQQVDLFQSGRVHQLVSTDAIGMGLNLDIRHIAFAGTSKFDGHQHRRLEPSELAQIAGRAGRFTKDGTFGLTTECADRGGLPQTVIEAIEQHSFSSVKKIWYRNSDWDFSSVEALWRSLHRRPFKWCLMPVRDPADEQALHALLEEGDIAWAAKTPSLLSVLWDVCRIPNFSQTGAAAHHGLLKAIYRQLVTESGMLKTRWIERKLYDLETRDGGISFVMGQLERVRTLAYVAHRADWVSDPDSLRIRCLHLEEKLSVRLHERLTHRFVDEMSEGIVNRPQPQEVSFDGTTIQSTGGSLGHLQGFSFVPDASAERIFGVRQTRKSAHLVVREQATLLAHQFLKAPQLELGWDDDLQLCWKNIPLAWLEKGASMDAPKLKMYALELLPSDARRLMHARLLDSLKVERKQLQDRIWSNNLSLKGVIFALRKSFGILDRAEIDFMFKKLNRKDWKSLSQAKITVTPEWVVARSMMGPSSQRIRAVYAAVWLENSKLPDLPKGSCSHTFDWSDDFARIMGFERRGKLWVRMDIAERVRKKLKSIRGSTPWEIPNEPMSWLGCNREQWHSVIRAYGYRLREAKLFPPRRR